MFGVDLFIISDLWINYFKNNYIIIVPVVSGLISSIFSFFWYIDNSTHDEYINMLALYAQCREATPKLLFSIENNLYLLFGFKYYYFFENKEFLISIECTDDNNIKNLLLYILYKTSKKIIISKSNINSSNYIWQYLYIRSNHNILNKIRFGWLTIKILNKLIIINE